MLDDKKVGDHAETLPCPPGARWQPGALLQKHLLGSVGAPRSAVTELQAKSKRDD